jgi:hypothetical protein
MGRYWVLEQCSIEPVVNKKNLFLRKREGVLADKLKIILGV